MKLIIFISAFIVVTILELAFFPTLARATVPALGFFTLMLGLAVLNEGKFWFAFLSGIIKDMLALHSAFIYTPWFISLFLVVFTVDALMPFEPAPRRILGAAAGLIAAPLLWALLNRRALEHALLGRDIVFGGLLFLLFALALVLRARQERVRALSHLSP